MNRKITAIIAVLVVVIVLIGVTVAVKTRDTEPAVTDTTVPMLAVTVLEVAVREVDEGVSDAGVYATQSDGETRLIARSDDFRQTQDPERSDSYRDAQISPSGRFVAASGIGFEDAFIRVYDVQTLVLHEKIYGVSEGWTDDDLLQIESCDLSGERCVDKISVNAETPWVVVDVPGTATGQEYGSTDTY
ncbi:MAG: hypothetical protein V4644_02565 [Patescibacteria group bacterium]